MDNSVIRHQIGRQSVARLLSFLILICIACPLYASTLPKLEVVTSLSCPHCAEHIEDLEKTIQEAQNDGIISPDVTWVDYPTDLATLVATKLSWIKGESERLKLYRVFLLSQKDWHTKEWRTELKKIALNHGITSDQVDACMNVKDDSPTEKLEDFILDRLKKIINRHGLSFVPAFILNDTVLVTETTKKELYKAAKALLQNPLAPASLPKQSHEENTPHIIESIHISSDPDDQRSE